MIQHLHINSICLEVNKMEKTDHILLTTLLSVVQDGICFLSPELEVLYQNPAMQYWYETSEKSYGEKCYALYHGRSTPCEHCPAQRAIHPGIMEEQEVLFSKNSRKQGWHKVFCAPVYGEDGQVKLIVEYVRNLTGERAAVLSAELVESQNRALMDMLSQREEEQRRLEQRRAENMNQSISSILRYLRATLDSRSYELISRQLELLKNQHEHHDAGAAVLRAGVGNCKGYCKRLCEQGNSGSHGTFKENGGLPQKQHPQKAGARPEG